eukprot:762969-Hanusia_phi.AAC.2
MGRVSAAIEGGGGGTTKMLANGLMIEGEEDRAETYLEDEDEDEDDYPDITREEAAWQMRRLQLIMNELQQDCDRLRASLCVSEFQRGMHIMERDQKTGQVESKFSEIIEGLNNLHDRECAGMDDELKTKSRDLRERHDACQGSVVRIEQANRKLLKEIASAAQNIVLVEQESQKVREKIKSCTLNVKRSEKWRSGLEERARDSQIKTTCLQNKSKILEEELDSLRSSIRHNQEYARHVASISSARPM